MSIFSRIKDAIFGSAAAQEAPPAATAAAPPAQGSAAAPAAGATTAPASQATASSPAPNAPMSQVDVEAVLTGLAAKKGQKLDWRKSIVDLMKLLDLDSGLEARKELAKELNYTGDASDSASMNVWLHKQVMAKLAASGGKVPEDLRT
jgi:3-oxoacyl-ACP reductase-like protein